MSVANGYHNQDPELSDCFNVQIEDEQGCISQNRRPRFIHDGELFVTGRVRDLIVRGRNIHPQDIELTAQGAASGAPREPQRCLRGDRLRSGRRGYLATGQGHAAQLRR